MMVNLQFIVNFLTIMAGLAPLISNVQKFGPKFVGEKIRWRFKGCGKKFGYFELYLPVKFVLYLRKNLLVSYKKQESVGKIPKGGNLQIGQFVMRPKKHKLKDAQLWTLTF